MESVGNRDRPPTMDSGPGMPLPPPPREEFFFQPKTKVCVKVQGKVVGGEFGMWIFASVLGYHPKAKKYEIVDEDGEEKKKYKIHRKWVQRLPTDWESRPNVKGGDLCFAMFPETTSFYLAKVIQVANDENQFYQLRFEDDDEEGLTPTRKEMGKSSSSMGEGISGLSLRSEEDLLLKSRNKATDPKNMMEEQILISEDQNERTIQEENIQEESSEEDEM